MKIGLIAVYREMAEVARKAALTLEEELDLIIREAVLDKALDSACEMVARGVEVLISRGGTAEELRRSVEIPVVDCRITTYDILLALYKARSHGKKIGLVMLDKTFFDMSVLAQILGIKIDLFLFRDRNGLRPALLKAREAGVAVVVGGIVTVQMAHALGLPAILVESHEDTIRQAIHKAIEIANVRRKEKVQKEQFQAIVQHANTGIIAVDQKGMITVFNPVAERTFNLKAAGVTGKPLWEVFGEFGFLQNRLETSRIGELQTVAGVNILVNCVPLKVDGNINGMVVTFEEVSRLQKVEQKIRRELYAKGLVARWTFADIVGKSKIFQQVIDQAREFARFDSTVLIIGETGTGKELFAQSIHNAGPRSQGPFVAINCSALPENLLESELFGYEEGAFTGAKKGGKPGLFELAHNGTIFLDEIGTISPNLQARLLRVIQEREVMRIGGDRVIPINVRIIAATNQDLLRMVVSGKFREDLYFRLNVLQLNIPPLREREEDVLLLFSYFTRQIAQKLGKNAKEATPEQLKKMLRYYWPGNVRELENFAQKYVILCEQSQNLDLLFNQFNTLTQMWEQKHLQGRNKKTATPSNLELRPKIESLELQHIADVLHSCSSREEAARLLGISLSTLNRRIKKLKGFTFYQK